MSSNRFGSYRGKEEVQKELTPKSNKYSPKISPVFASLRGGMGVKAEGSSKIKLSKPATTKHAPESAPYFHAKDSADKRGFYNSNKRLELNKGSTVKNGYEYQPRSKSKSPARQVDEIIREEVCIQPRTFNLVDRCVKTVENKHPPLPKTLAPISNFEPAKHSKNGHGTIRAYSASTNQGPVREYNEDRVAIILNFSRPEGVADWKKPAYFGVFDGHGGMECADFLRDNLHAFISKDRSFPLKMDEAIKGGCEKCEKAYLDQSYMGKVDRSGSCALLAFFYGRECYIANVGDSRAIMSSRHGQLVRELSMDHKASDEFEQKRILEAGGRIYQYSSPHSGPRSRTRTPISKYFTKGKSTPSFWDLTEPFPGDSQSLVPSEILRPSTHSSEAIPELLSASLR